MTYGHHNHPPRARRAGGGREADALRNAEIINVTGEYADYLRDESRSFGRAETISFPAGEADIISILKRVRAARSTLTVQGARTGIAAGAVPDGGHILNLSRMNRINGLRRGPDGSFFVTVQPGVLLSELRAALATKRFETDGWTTEAAACLAEFRAAGAWFFPSDPTETSASLGGMAACNASGARSFRYGPVRPYIEAARVVLADGTTVELRRGREKADGRAFCLRQGERVVAAGNLPAYQLPAVKNASGYYAADDMDLLDLFIGSEGTLGIITEIELRLLPEPPLRWGMTAFFPSEAAALTFVRQVRDTAADRKPAAIEYFNHKALGLLREQRTNPAFAGIPELPAEYHTAVYTEFHGEDEDALTDAAGEASEKLIACGGDDAATWFAMNDREMERHHFFRHAVPEAVNLLIDRRRRAEPQLTKLGTDMAVPDAALTAVVDMYNRDLAASGLDSVMFGHIGDNHIHVNILPNNLAEYEQGRELYTAWAREVIRLGGTVSAEHGVGKLKAGLLREMYGEAGVAQMKAVKEVFDPAGILNRGNLFGVRPE